MPGFNGSGTFVRTYNWTLDAANAIPILASRFDTEDNGFATGLSNVICRDGQSTISADIPFNSKKITGLADAVAVTDAVNLQTGDARYLRSQVKRTTAATLRHSTTTLTADPYLTMTLVAGVYALEALLIVGNVITSDTNGLKMDFTYSGTVTSSWVRYAGYTNTAAIAQRAILYNTTRTFSQLEVFAANAADVIELTGTVIVSTGGTFALRWAQNSNTTTDTAIDIGSWLRMSLIA